MKNVSLLCLIVMIFIGTDTVNSTNKVKSISPDSTNSVKLILGWEGNYMRIVSKSIDSNLTDENFAYSNAGINTMIISTDAQYGNLPPKKRPILVIPNGNFLTGVYYAKLYPRVNILMCYLNGSIMSSYYSPNDSVPSNLMFIAGGNMLNDWTTGSQFDFIDSTDIQYLGSDLTPRYNYRISNFKKNRDGTAKVYNQTITAQTRVGWQVWLNINTSGISNIRSAAIRSRVLSINADSGYIVINNMDKFPNKFISGSIKVNWLSGSVTAAAVKISRIMEERHCSFYEATLCARMTASNNGVRNDMNGYGHINVQAAIDHRLSASLQKECEIFDSATGTSYTTNNH